MPIHAMQEVSSLPKKQMQKPMHQPMRAAQGTPFNCQCSQDAECLASQASPCRWQLLQQAANMAQLLQPRLTAPHVVQATAPQGSIGFSSLVLLGSCTPKQALAVKGGNRANLSIH